MGEQAGPRQLVDDAVRAEEIGSDFLAASDHYLPWLEEQGHSPYTWSVLGAVAPATDHVEFDDYVTCPTIRYHPAVVAQKAATVDLLSGHRFTLGLGAGENLNEHVVGTNIHVGSSSSKPMVAYAGVAPSSTDRSSERPQKSASPAALPQSNVYIPISRRPS